MNTVIYGAQAIALGTYKAIKTLFPDQNIRCFLVTEKGNNANTLGGLPVYELEEFALGMSQEEKDNTKVLISTPEPVMDAIEKSLDEAGLSNHVRLTSLRWAHMMQNAFVKTGEYMPLTAYPVGVKEADVHVYKMTHQLDKALQTEYQDPEYVNVVQVGTALTEKKSADFYDNDGDNISDRNRNYSELTGLYWMWKNQILKDNSNDSYYGLAHYRRFLHLCEDDLLRLDDNDIDVVLPYPMPYEPNIEAHHERYLTEEEWSAVLQALEELQPEYAVAFKDILKQGYMYNYNIIIAKSKVLSDYCEWLYPILFRIEEINNPDGTKEPNRYMGYIGETLETLYFMYNKQGLKITHAGCRFLV